MNWYGQLLLILLLSYWFSGVIAATAGKENQISGSEIPGEILIRFYEGIEKERMEEIFRENHILSKKSLGRPGMYRIKFSGSHSLQEMLEIFRSYPEVKYAEPNQRIYMEPSR